MLWNTLIPNHKWTTRSYIVVQYQSQSDGVEWAMGLFGSSLPGSVLRRPILDAWGCDCCLAGDAQASRATKQALWAPYLELLNAAFPFRSERDVTEQDLQFSEVQS